MDESAHGGGGAPPAGGRAVTALETVKEELTPALPAGTDGDPAVTRSGPADADLEVLLDWSGQ